MKLKGENKAGIYITVIFHLTVIIVLLLIQLGSAIDKESSFVLDFTKQEELEKELQEQIFKEEISKRLDEMIAASSSPSEIKNISVNTSSVLKDDRNTDAEKLYEDAQRLAEELKNGQKIDASDETVEIVKKDTKNEDKKMAYSGPSVLSWTLDGRSAVNLRIPAYKCEGAGDVSVAITVNEAGSVIDVRIIDAVSSNDICLRNYATRAARLSKFSIKTGQKKQIGEITYRFIAQ